MNEYEYGWDDGLLSFNDALRIANRIRHEQAVLDEERMGSLPGNLLALRQRVTTAVAG